MCATLCVFCTCLLVRCFQSVSVPFQPSLLIRLLTTEVKVKVLQRDRMCWPEHAATEGTKSVGWGKAIQGCRPSRYTINLLASNECGLWPKLLYSIYSFLLPLFSFLTAIKARRIDFLIPNPPPFFFNWMPLWRCLPPLYPESIEYLHVHGTKVQARTITRSQRGSALLIKQRPLVPAPDFRPRCFPRLSARCSYSPDYFIHISSTSPSCTRFNVEQWESKCKMHFTVAISSSLPPSSSG